MPSYRTRNPDYYQKYCILITNYITCNLRVKFVIIIIRLFVITQCNYESSVLL